MNTKLPFEEAMKRQFENLPALHEDASWQKMNELLNEKQKRIPPPFNNFKTWGLLTLLLLTIGLGVFVISKKSATKMDLVATTRSISSSSAEQSKPSAMSATEHVDVAERKNEPSNAVKAGSFNPSVKAFSGVNDKAVTVNGESFSSVSSDRHMEPSGKQSSAVAAKPNGSQASERNVARARHSKKLIKHKGMLLASSGVSKEVHKDVAKNEQKAKATNYDQATLKNTNSDKTTSYEAAEKAIKETKAIDTLAQTKSSKEVKQQPESQSIVSKGAVAARHQVQKYFVTAGVGLQQSIPVGGQKNIAYGFNGRSALSDYIPSIYATFEKSGRWFLQAEFNYGAPQLVKHFAYSRSTTFDNTSRTLTTTTYNLKKTFYSEVPVSFNYYVKPGWSFGTGVMYSWLHGAIAEKEVAIKNVQTQQQSVITDIEPIKGFTDSFLYKSHTYLLLQTSYQLNRFTFGLRYSRDMQPYIRYTLPDGMVADKKNWSLEFMLRFRLWKSKLF